MRERTETADGVRVHLLANINLLSEVSLARDLKVEGIGLYRTEFPFFVRTALPSEEEQFSVYRRLVQMLPGRQITFRTLDVGGEKHLPYLDAAPETNPELGLRAIRFSFQHPDLFGAQLRAILRAARENGPLRILFPMIASLDDFVRARQAVDQAMVELARQGLAPAERPPLGVMVEVPALLEVMTEMARMADFLAIGTNDLIQYLLGVDRSNERVAAYYRPGHPSVLRALARVVAAAREAGIEASVCGEMGHDPLFVPFFIGIGLRRFSVDPQFLPPLQVQIGRLDAALARRYADELLAAASVAEVQTVLHGWDFGRSSIPVPPENAA
jgi:phosphotransferase system enzyme I (PtsP)